MPELIVVVPATVPFPSLTSDLGTLRTLLADLSRADVLFWCARLNLVLSNPLARGVQQWAVQKFFDETQVRRLNDFARDHGGGSGVRVFCRAQLLELFRWACLLGRDRHDDGTTFTNERARRRFAKAALVAGDLWMERTYAATLGTSDDMARERRIGMSVLRNASRQSEPAMELHRALARAAVIGEQNFPTHYPRAESELQAVHGLSIGEYVAAGTGILLEFGGLTPETADSKTGLFRRSEVGAALKPAASAALDRFVALEAASPAAFAARFMNGADVPSASDPFDWRPFRDHPILETPDGRCMLVDVDILSEKLAFGPAFHLSTHRRALGRAASAPLSALGHAFEAYCVRLLRDAGFGVIANPKRTAAKGTVELTDVVAITQGAALVCEAKNIFLRESVALGTDASAYEDEIRKNYVGSPEEPKGVGQIARAVARFAEVGYVQQPGDLAGVDVLVPVLVVRDPSICSLGHLELFASEFDAALGRFAPPSVDGMLGPFKVPALTVMSIEDLETLAASSAMLSLPALLLDYAAKQYEGARPSLHDFMCAHQHRYKFSQGGLVAGIGLSKLEEVAQNLYGDVAIRSSVG